MRRRLFRILNAVAVLGLCTTLGLANQPNKKLLEPMDVFQLEYASDPQISPTGQQVVYVRNSMDVMHDRVRSELWMVDVTGSGHRPLAAKGNVSQPRWSPDGTRLAYVTQDGDGRSQIFVRWMDSGDTARVTQLGEGPGHLQWSPDGKQLAFVMLVPSKTPPLVEMPEKPKGAKWADPPRVVRDVHYRHDGDGYLKSGFRHIFTVPADGGSPRQLTSGNFNHSGPVSWSPDGESIYFSANRNQDWEYQPSESDIFRLTVASGSLKQLTDRIGPDDHPIVSPNGRQIAWVGYDDQKLSHQTTRLYVMNADGSERREITKRFDRNVDTPLWNEAGDKIYFQFDDTGTTKIGQVTLDGKVTELAGHVGGVTIGRPYSSGSFSVAGQRFAYTLGTSDHPAEVAVGSESGADVVRLTQLNQDLFERRTLATTKMFWFESSVDQRQIQGWVVKPPGFDPNKKYPLILEIHGGPFANYGDRFSAEMQYYAAAGYVVLYVNPRGSTSYGEDFANLIHHKYPAGDYDDLMDGVDAVIAQGYVDPNNLFVTGGSGGGILTAWVVGKTNRFKAAVAAKPVINWYSFVLITDAYPYFSNYWFPGVPWEHEEHYFRRSPISLVGNVTTPTMLITGEQDHRTPISEAEQFYQALKLQHVDTMLIRVPDASHNIVKRPSRLIAKTQYILKWFSMYRDQP